MELLSHAITLEPWQEFIAQVPSGKTFVLTTLCWETQAGDGFIDIYENDTLKVTLCGWIPSQVFYTGIPFRGGSSIRLKNNEPEPITFTIVGHLVEGAKEDTNFLSNPALNLQDR